MALEVVMMKGIPFIYIILTACSFALEWP